MEISLEWGATRICTGAILFLVYINDLEEGRLSSIPIVPIFQQFLLTPIFENFLFFFLFLWGFRFAARFFAANPQISLRRTCFLS